MKRIWALALLTSTLGLLVGCRRVEEPPASLPTGDVHHAPHGGTLLEVGEHAFSLELIVDPTARKLTAYVLDAHAENFIRIAAPTIEVIATVGAERRPLTLRAIANRATGETVGNTSQFEDTAGWLGTTPEFQVVIPTLEIRGMKFENLEVPLRKPM